MRPDRERACSPFSEGFRECRIDKAVPGDPALPAKASAVISTR